MLNPQALSIAARAGAGLLGVTLIVYHWNGAGDVPGAGGNLFLLAALFMCLGLVLLSDPLIDEPGLRGIAKLCGYAGIVGIGTATLF